MYSALSRFRVITLLFFLLPCSIQTLAEDKEPAKHSGGDWVDTMKVAVAWGLVPLGSEFVLNASETLLAKHLFWLKLLKIHSSNIRRATGQHLTENLSAMLENYSYKIISDESKKKHTDALQAELVLRSLTTFSMISKHAQKSRKTYLRLQDITDTLAASARLALKRGEVGRASGLMAFAAQLVLYLHPEYRAEDVFNSVHINFAKHVQWRDYPDFRQRLLEHLARMEPLYDKSALIQLRYCDLLNSWLLGSESCTVMEAKAIKEMGALAEAVEKKEGKSFEPTSFSEEFYGYVDWAFKGVAGKTKAEQMRNGVFVLGVSVPGAFMYFVGKQHPALDVVIKHFSKIVGLATTKDTIELMTSQSRRTLENWGAINTGSTVNKRSGLTDFTNFYFSALQKSAGAILAEQPNYARSNLQRAIELLVIHFADAHVSEEDDTGRAAILAAALVHAHREIVEISVHDTLIASLLRAYRPYGRYADKPLIQEHLKSLDSDYASNLETRTGYRRLLKTWAEYSEGSELSFGLRGHVVKTDFEETCSADMCPDGSDSPGVKTASPIISPETMTTLGIHGIALTYNVGMAIIQPRLIDRFKPKLGIKRSYMHLSVYYFLLSMVDFGLRSIGEPAIVHLQTVIKNQIGRRTGILTSEDLTIQDELASKVNELNRELSIEAQTSRSYKMTVETLLVKGASLAAMTMESSDNPHVDSAAMLAYTAYIYRYFHPEFEPADEVVAALVKARLGGMFTELRRSGLTSAYSRQVFMALAQLDSNFSKPIIKGLYTEILDAWGLRCQHKDILEAEDVLQSWAVFGDYLMGGGGFVLQALIKAGVHNRGFITRTVVHFGANILEFGTTDPLRHKMYAYTRQKMMNLFFTGDLPEQLAAEYANEQLTNSFRRQKFHFGKPELGMRTQIVQIITSIINGFSEAQFALMEEDEERASDLIALCMTRLILYTPDFSVDDQHLSDAINTLIKPVHSQLDSMNETVLAKVGHLLASEPGISEKHYEEGMNKARGISALWHLPQD